MLIHFVFFWRCIFDLINGLVLEVIWNELLNSFGFMADGITIFSAFFLLIFWCFACLIDGWLVLAGVLSTILFVLATCVFLVLLVTWWFSVFLCYLLLMLCLCPLYLLSDSCLTCDDSFIFHKRDLLFLWHWFCMFLYLIIYSLYIIKRYVHQVLWLISSFWTVMFKLTRRMRSWAIDTEAHFIDEMSASLHKVSAQQISCFV